MTARSPALQRKAPEERLRAAPAGAFIACGERVTLPSPEVATIVGRINELWGAHVRVYQTIAPMPPHAAAGGCIFYNRGALLALMGNRLQVGDTQIAGPLLYAIFAHEVGHELHHDLDPSRASVPSREQRTGGRSFRWLHDAKARNSCGRPRSLLEYGW